MTSPLLHNIPAGGSPWLQMAITLFLVLHVGAGSVAIASGFGAIFTRKAGSAHRASGTVFFGSMLIMSVMGAMLAVILRQPGNIIGGALAFYLATTGWKTIRRKDRGVGPAEIAGLVAALGATGALTVLGLQAGSGRGEQATVTLYLVFGALAALFTILDLKVILQGGVTGRPRIARHLWRMCLALFFASGSFFLGQQKVMPIWMQGSPILFVPAFALLALMAFWLIRVRLRPLGRLPDRPQIAGQAI